MVQLMCVCRAVTDYRSMSYVSADVSRLRLYVIRSVGRSTTDCTCDSAYHCVTVRVLRDVCEHVYHFHVVQR